MATVTTHFQTLPVSTEATLPKVGEQAPAFTLATKELTEISLTDLAGQRVVLNIFPSLDTPVCAASVRRFNAEVSKLDNTQVLCVSMDLPFAAARFCTANGIDNVTPASAFRSHFGHDYGVLMTDGPLRGLLARAIVVIDENGKVIYSHINNQITEEPDYAAVLAALGK